MKKTMIIDGVEYELTPVTKKEPLVVKREIHLEIHPEDFGKMTWDEATTVVKKLGEGWRLPTITELYIINESNLKHYFNHKEYWSTATTQRGSSFSTLGVPSPTISSTPSMYVRFEMQNNNKMNTYVNWLERQIDRCLEDKDLQREHWAFCKAYEKFMELQMVKGGAV